MQCQTKDVAENVAFYHAGTGPIFKQKTWFQRPLRAQANFPAQPIRQKHIYTWVTYRSAEVHHRQSRLPRLTTGDHRAARQNSDPRWQREGMTRVKNGEASVWGGWNGQVSSEEQRTHTTASPVPRSALT
ncbi:hypothetical protein SKAU_G00088280 [Synaphobranchus kaupii]|uniref:Uncharacterized protein n=1 Tax=Synaphobranchus kaupii TaxID=118154 RepID=A0A9Q1FX11_SYNKA|nr:hypothetical protein SKAU_G00088280 [Synaphobranchus kaupii]